MRTFITSFLIVAFLLSAPNAEALTRDTRESEPLFTRDMTERELDLAIRDAMPFPVISTLYTVVADQRHFAVNLRHPTIGVFHVNWHVPTGADRELIMKSLKAARNHAVSAARRLAH